MNVSQDIKIEIQSFVYFLFKGTIDNRLIIHGFDYLKILLDNPVLLYNCFKVFACACQDNIKNPTAKVADYIIDLNKNDTDAFQNLDRYLGKKGIHTSFWNDFLALAEYFCFNSFPEKIICNYLPYLNGTGTDAVPVFAIWTNIIQINQNEKILNLDKAMLRANERIKLLFDNIEPNNTFTKEELEQELY